MTRKDTIIVAVLINAGLLVMLFVSALKNEPTTSSRVAMKEDSPRIVEKEIASLRKEVPLVKPVSVNAEHPIAQPVKIAPKESVEKIKEEVAVIKPSVQQAVPARENALDKVLVAKKPIAQEELGKVIVKKGDVLEKIAKSYGTSVEALMQVNELVDAKLQVGQTLYLPKEKAASTTAIKVLPQVEENLYTIKPGDNLWKIAIEHHVKVEDLIKLNQLTEKQAKALRPGDRIKIK
ncbi:MAG: LysM peptidoglycan-binding domain-containing protein [Chlamydiota bacterium]